MKSVLNYLSILLLVSVSTATAQVKNPEPAKEEKAEFAVLPKIDKKAKAPKGVNLKLMAEDADYGYSDQKPIRVGSKDEFGGPRAEHEYLSLLLDAQGQRVRFVRLFSGGRDPQGTILDCYEVTTSKGEKVRLWISMYAEKNDPLKQPAPVGFYKLKKPVKE